jgi:hypothetical protein
MAVQARRDLDIGQPRGRIENHPRALHITPRRRYLPRATLKLIALLSAQLDHEATDPRHDHQFRRTPPASFT